MTLFERRDIISCLCLYEMIKCFMTVIVVTGIYVFVQITRLKTLCSNANLILTTVFPENHVRHCSHKCHKCTCLIITWSHNAQVTTSMPTQHFVIILTIFPFNSQQQGEQTYFEFLAQSFHSGQVTGLDVCLRKPLVATCSNDRSVRIWNYESWYVM